MAAIYGYIATACVHYFPYADSRRHLVAGRRPRRRLRQAIPQRTLAAGGTDAHLVAERQGMLVVGSKNININILNINIINIILAVGSKNINSRRLLIHVDMWLLYVAI